MEALGLLPLYSLDWIGLGSQCPNNVLAAGLCYTGPSYRGRFATEKGKGYERIWHRERKEKGRKSRRRDGRGDFDWCQNQRPWMTLNGRYAFCSRKEASFGAHHKKIE